MLPIISKFSEQLSRESIETIKKRYESSIDEIASIDPILAYKLSHASDFYRILDMQKQYFESIKNLVPSNEIRIYENVKSDVQSKMFDMAIENLEEGLKTLSRKADMLLWRKVKKFISETKNLNSQKTDQVINEFWDNYEKQLQMLQNTNKPSVAPTPLNKVGNNPVSIEKTPIKEIK